MSSPFTSFTFDAMPGPVVNVAVCAALVKAKKQPLV